MKKILAISILVLLLASCSQQDVRNGDDSTATDPTESEQVSSEYVCELKSGKKIPVGAEADGVISSLGQYVDYSEAPSCVHEGSDKIYTFIGFSVMTSPSDSGEKVTQVNILTDEEALANGITIGSAKSDVIAAYGECANEQFGIMNYELDGALLTINTDGDTVSAISISAK